MALALVLPSLLALRPCVPLDVRAPTHYAARSDDIMLAKFSPAYETTVRYKAADWAQNVRTLPRSMVLRRIASPLLFNFGLTLLTCIVHTALGPTLPSLLPLPHTLLGSALGLLLVFRTNAAYDRFWEARKQWDRVTSECRGLASLSCTFMTPRQAVPLLTLTAAFPVVLKNYLRGGGAKEQERDARRLRALLAPAEVNALTAVVNQPQYVLARMRMLAQASRTAGVSEKEREMLLKSCATLGECVSTCERIYNTPIPLAYSRHTSRFLVLYVSTLPLALVRSLGFGTLPAMLTVCWALFGILEIGNLVEEPFTAGIGGPTAKDGRPLQQPLLPLTEVCRTIRRDVRAIAQYSQLAVEYGVPTISRSPKTIVLPESFRELREFVKVGNGTLNAQNATARANASRPAGSV